MKLSIRMFVIAMTFVFSSAYAQNSNKTFTVKGVSFTMVYVEGGTFIMGDTSGNPNELLNMNNFIKEVSHPSIKATDDAEPITPNKCAVKCIYPWEMINQ